MLECDRIYRIGMVSRTWVYHGVLIFGMLAAGSINTLSKKFQNSTVASGLPNKTPHPFSHPWFQSWTMFIGETFCLIAYICTRYFIKKQQIKDYEGHTALVVNVDEDDRIDERIEDAKRPIFQKIFAIPACMDIIGTTLGGIGLLYIEASLWQMFRGSLVVFTGILGMIFLKRKLHLYNWVGMLIVVGGLCLVGLSSILEHSSSSSKKKSGVGIGIMFVLLGQFCSAGQMVVEEKFLKAYKFRPLHVVGMEGLFGVILMTFIVLPLVYFIPGNMPAFNNRKSYDNSIDALVMIYNSPALLGYTLMYLGSISFYNFCGLAVTNALTAVHRTLIDALRTISVWGVELILYYAGAQILGEPWHSHSYLQLIGFVLLFFGTLIYNVVIKIPGLYNPCSKSDEDSETTPLISED